MSYDYAMGYLVSAASAKFLVYETNPTNTIFAIKFMPPLVLDKIDRAIAGRIDFVQGAMKVDFQQQFERLQTYLNTLTDPPAPALPTVAPVVPVKPPTPATAQPTPQATTPTNNDTPNI